MGAGDPIVIVGSGLAGYAVARELRKRDAQAPVLMVTADDGAAYYKPAISNAYSAGTAPEALVQQPGAAAAAKLGIELRPFTRVTGIDAAAHRLLTDGGAIAYRAAVLAHGARANPLRPAGEGPVYQVNSLADYRRFHAALSGVRRVAVIGAGLIGCEFANDLALGGAEVICSDTSPEPLGRLLPPTAGAALRTALAEVGVRWQLARAAAALEPSAHGVRVRYADGAEAEVDVVLAAVGLAPEVELAKALGLSADRGIPVDDHLRTALPDVYAIGDCARYPNGWLPFVAPILQAAGPLAKTLLGEPTPVRFPLMPVKVKTKTLPVVVLPPPPTAPGAWHIEADSARDIAATYRDPDGHALGFALLGEAGKRKDALVNEMNTKETA